MGDLVLLAGIGGTLAGCCQLERRSDAEAYFGMFSVQPGRQRRTVASGSGRAAGPAGQEEPGQCG